MTRTQDITGTPSALPGVTAGTGYALQLVSGAEAFVSTGAAASTTDHWRLRTLDKISLQPAAGESIWAWTTGIEGQITFDETF